MATPELHVAVFGASGAGKTVLLSAFFRAQTQASFQTEHGYKIQAVNRAQGSQLLGRFYDLENGKFPDGSTRFEDYAFDFYARDISEPAVRIHWYDYPGRWWEDEPQDAEERASMHDGLQRLGKSHVGVLLVDGAKYKAEGISYIRWLLEHFANECDRLRRHGKAAKISVAFPREWILALSKADLAATNGVAQDFERDVVRGAGNQLVNLSSVVGTDGAFGHRFMLLSSVMVTNDAKIDPQTSLGLRTLAPAVLLSTLEGAAREAQSKVKDKSFGESVLDGLRGLFKLIDSLDDFLPEKYQVITKVLRVIPLEDLMTRKLDKLQKAREDAIRKGDAFKAVVNGMAAALINEEGTRAYFRNQ